MYLKSIFVGLACKLLPCKFFIYYFGSLDPHWLAVLVKLMMKNCCKCLSLIKFVRSNPSLSGSTKLYTCESSERVGEEGKELEGGKETVRRTWAVVYVSIKLLIIFLSVKYGHE